MGISLAVDGRHRGRPSALRSGARALRSCRASPAGDAIWPRRRGGILCFRSLALWLLGYPDAALADAEQALKDAREIGQAANFDVCAVRHGLTHILCGNYAAAKAQADEAVALADEKGALFGRPVEQSMQGCVLALTGKASDAVQMITSAHCRIAVNGNNSLDRRCTCHIWREPMLILANSMMLGAALAKQSGGGNNQGKMVRGRG